MQKTCNIGALGSDEGAGYAMYKHMRVGYSGYGGTGGMPGKEWISVEGVTTTNLIMKAYAFETGTAIISYKFDRVQTSKCLGLTPFTGTFTLHVAKNSVVDIGEIPREKKNLQVNLRQLILKKLYKNSFKNGQPTSLKLHFMVI